MVTAPQVDARPRNVDPAHRPPADPGQGSVFVVPATETLWIDLPEMPATRSELAAMLAARSPLPLSATASTSAWREEDGAVRVALVRRAFLDRSIAALPPRQQRDVTTVTQDGRSVRYTPPAARRRVLTTAAIVGFALVGAVGVLASVPETEDPRKAASPAPADALFARAGMVSTLAALPPPPPGATLAAIAGDPAGATSVEWRTADPDRLRAALGETAALAGQTRDGGGAYVVTQSLPDPGGVASGAAAPALRARDAEEARAVLDDRVRALAQDRVLQIALTRGDAPVGRIGLGVRAVGPQADVLAFAAAIESGVPPMRFARWRLERHASGAALSGTVIAPWTSAP